MRFDDDFYGKGTNSLSRIIMGCIFALIAVTLVAAIVLLANNDKLKKEKKSELYQNANQNSSQNKDKDDEKDDFKMSEEKRTSDELDFWHMYDKPEDQTESEEGVQYYDDSSSSRKKSSSKKSSSSKKENESPGKNDVGTVVDESEDGRTEFDASDSGEPEMVEIFDSIPLNKYDAGAFRQEGNQLQYYSGNRKVSTYGIDISKYQGSIDWEKVADSGVEFAMIRMGVRGYNSGKVVIDETFSDNMAAAIKNGIDVGIYFYSQAINADEAVEEANYAVVAATPYSLTYPIVFYSEAIVSDAARTDALSADELTAIAKTFCDTVRSYGYKPMICASKHQLATKLDMSVLKDYDVWLIDAPKVKSEKKLKKSEYPYQYMIWQYSADGVVDGIDGPVDLNISFVDYKYR